MAGASAGRELLWRVGLVIGHFSIHGPAIAVSKSYKHRINSAQMHIQQQPRRRRRRRRQQQQQQQQNTCQLHNVSNESEKLAVISREAVTHC